MYNVDVIHDWGDALHCVGFVEDVENLFQVNMIKLSENRWYSHQNYVIPEQIQDIIVFVDGISNQPRSYLPHPTEHVNSPIVDDSYSGREVVYRLYNVTSVEDVASTISVGSIEYQNESGFSMADLLESQQMNNVKLRNVSHIVGNDVEPDLESQLDMQMMATNVPNADIWFWDGTDWLYSLAVNMSSKKLNIVSWKLV